MIVKNTKLRPFAIASFMSKSYIVSTYKASIFSFYKQATQKKKILESLH